MTDHVTEIACERAWAAGFFDGEGCTTFAVAQWNGLRYIQLRVTQKDLRPLERFHAIVGEGHIHGPKSNGTHQWCASGNGARRAMQVIHPWLSAPKIEQWLSVEATCVPAGDRRRREVISRGAP